MTERFQQEPDFINIRDETIEVVSTESKQVLDVTGAQITTEFTDSVGSVLQVEREGTPQVIALDTLANHLVFIREDGLGLLVANTGGQGPAGPQGSTGVQGPQGVVGPQGPDGAEGPQGVQGTTGVQGPQGVEGAAGPQGSIGATGAQGAAGVQGPQGELGGPGPQGAQGNVGAQGPQGVVGGVGSQGPQGVPGTAGDTGPQGVAGSQGPQGNIGSQGPQGDTGLSGPQGFQGVGGAQGPQGAVGAPGATGAQGYQGNPGVAGPQGPQGDVGATGSQGPQGFTGATGGTGPQGLTGDTGPQGVQGATGPQGVNGNSVEHRGDWTYPKDYYTLDIVKEPTIGWSFICKFSHTASTDKRPGVGANWKLYWDTIAEKGDQGAMGYQGPQGYQGNDGADGGGVPNGGAQDQVLTKLSATDQDVGWQDAPSGLPAGGTTDQVLAKLSGTDYDVGWQDASGGGGAAYQNIWTTATSYAVGDIVIHEPYGDTDGITKTGIPYICTSAHTSAAGSGTSANEPGGNNYWIFYWHRLGHHYRGPWSTYYAVAYAQFFEGDIVTHNGDLWLCIDSGINNNDAAEPGVGASTDSFWERIDITGEGTWTPSLDGLVWTTETYSNQEGWYIKTGRTCTVLIDLHVTDAVPASGYGTNTVYLTLPFDSKSLTGSSYWEEPVNVWTDIAGTDTKVEVTAVIWFGRMYFRLESDTTHNTLLGNVDGNQCNTWNEFRIKGQVTYLVNDA